MNRPEKAYGQFIAGIPEQTGKTAIITGATSGIGLAAARVLASRGADVVIASRNGRKCEQLVKDIRASKPSGSVGFSCLDTANLESVRDFASRWNGKIDFLVLNAGISNVPEREITIDGLERQFATNYLGHFALTSLLLPYMENDPASRIVSTDSLAAARTRLDLGDLQLEHGYTPMRAYERSKLALLTFTLELARRTRSSGKEYRVIATHPGVASTGITRGGDRNNPVLTALSKWMFGVVGQSAEEGSMSMLYALTVADAVNGGYYGPSGNGGRKGSPTEVAIPSQALEEEMAERLWVLSEKLASLRFEA